MKLTDAQMEALISTGVFDQSRAGVYLEDKKDMDEEEWDYALLLRSSVEVSTQTLALSDEHDAIAAMLTHYANYHDDISREPRVPAEERNYARRARTTLEKLVAKVRRAQGGRR